MTGYEFSCERCRGKTRFTLTSRFDMTEICPACEREESAHPSYRDASTAQEREYRDGNFRFTGVGCPPDLREAAILRKEAGRTPRSGWIYLYHRSSNDNARKILVAGFRDTEMLVGDQHMEGVFASDIPLSANERAEGDALLEIRVRSDGANLDVWEVARVAGYREWFIPSDWLNAHATIRVVEWDLDEHPRPRVRTRK